MKLISSIILIAEPPSGFYFWFFTEMFFAGTVILILASLWKIFTKSGKAGWAAIIPIYNIVVFLEVIGIPWWWLLFFFIPYFNIIILILLIHQLSLAFSKSYGFTIGLILLPFIFFPILGFGNSKYTVNVEKFSNQNDII